MPELYIVRAQPNPRGRDVARPGVATNAALNEEWIEFEAQVARSLYGHLLSHLTFAPSCQVTGQAAIHRFGFLQLSRGHRVRVHTGSGMDRWVGSTYHVYLNHSWFLWNNTCGDRATLSYENRVIDSAYYRPNPPEGELVRVAGTDRLEPAGRSSYAFR